MQRRQKKGISTVIATVLLIPVLVLGLGAMTWSLGIQNNLGYIITEKSVKDTERVNERFEIQDAKIDNNKLNMTVANTGTLPVKLVRMWVTNTTASNGWHQSYDINNNINPGDSLSNFGTTLPLTASNASSYKISVITERGSSANFQMFSAKDRAVQMSLFASPRSIPTGQDVTLLFGVTNNLTDGIIVQSLKPMLTVTKVEGPSGTVTATATLVSGPTPTTEQSLAPAETIFFKWVYNIAGDEDDRIDFNATLVNAKQGNFVTESATVVIDSFVEQSSFSLDTLGVTSSSQVLVKKDIFTKTNTTGIQSVTDVGFQPKAVIFFWTRQDVEGNASGIRSGIGFASGPSDERVIAMASDDNAATSNTGKYQSESRSIAILLNGTPTVAAEAELVSFDPNGFTLNWLTNENRMDIIHYVAFAGTDLTDALASSFTVTASSSDQQVTTGFKPDFLMLMSIDHNSNGTSTPAELHVGMASSPTSRGTVGINLEDNLSSGSSRDTRVWQRNDRALLEFLDTGGQDMLIDIKSFDTNGFTIKKDPPDPDATRVHYLAFKGGAYKVGSFTKPSIIGIQSIPGLPFRPGALLFMSSNLPTNSAEQGEGRMFIGATDGTRSGAIWFHDKDNLINTDANQRTTTSRLAVLASQNTLRANATLDSFQSDGFRLNWLFNDSQADEILYLAIGNVTLVYNTVEVQVNMTNSGTNTLWVDRNTSIVFNNTATGKVYAGIIKKWENVTAATSGNINSTIDSDSWEKNKILKFYFSEPMVIPGDPGSGESVKAVPGEYYVYVRLSGYDDLGRSIMRVISLGIGRVV